MTRTRAFAFIAAAAALAVFPVAAPALADRLERESAAVDGRPVPTSSDDDAANIAVPLAPGAGVELTKMTTEQARVFAARQAELEFRAQYEELRANAARDANGAPPAPVDPAAAAGQRVAP